MNMTQHRNNVADTASHVCGLDIAYSILATPVIPVADGIILVFTECTMVPMEELDVSVLSVEP